MQNLPSQKVLSAHAEVAMLKVMKFGGSCLKTPEFLRKISQLVFAQDNIPVLVVSAVSGITDLLEHGLQEEGASPNRIEDIIQEVRKKHHHLLWKVDKKMRMKAILRMEVFLKKLEKFLLGVTYTGEITPSIRANILSYGERLSAILLEVVLKNAGKEAKALDSEEAGIVTDGLYENATADLFLCRRNLRQKVLPLLRSGIIPVITGFFGVTREGKVTLFGRNGSDYSAAVVAHSLDAEILELWKDVDGFMSADPRVVKNAHRIKRLSYYEAAELSYFGAKILHPRTFEPLLQQRIPIYVKNLSFPEEDGTVILPVSEERVEVIKSVAYNKDISIVSVYGPGVGYKPGIIAEIGKIFSEHGININSIITSQTCINLLLERKSAEKGYRLLLSSEVEAIERVRLRKDVALVAMVGEGLHRKKGLAARAFQAVASAGINIEMLSTGAPERAYYFIVKRNDVKRAVNSIHHEFFG